VGGFSFFLSLDLTSFVLARLSFWTRLPKPLPYGTFVWNFLGGESRPMIYKTPRAEKSNAFLHIHERKHVAFLRYVYLGKSRWLCLCRCRVPTGDNLFLCSSAANIPNAADMYLSAKMGELHHRLPTTIPFTIVSGDRAVRELGANFRGRPLRVVNPHNQTDLALYEQIISLH
jgi:hypothetical protein